MILSRTFFLLISFTLFLYSCKQKKKASLSGEETVEYADFVEFFKPVSLPFVYSDALLQQKETDSLLISSVNLYQFIPDSIIKTLYGKSKPKFYGLGKTGTTTGESYYFIKTVSPAKKALIILAFDQKEKYVGALKALVPDDNPNTVQAVSMDRRYSITQTIQLKHKDGSTSDGKDVYVLNTAANGFTLIMTDPLVDNSELVNPIDTLARKTKWAADYTNGKMNLVSIRDGRRPNIINFFIHFDKNNGSCRGEIKGEATMRTPNTAEYHEEGDPCILKFIFTGSSVSLQEVEGCGSKRPLDCTLNGSFAKKKPAKPLTPPKK